MAQTGYTPILIYSSTTVSQAPSASNLTNSTLGSELAINITDGKLFYKDNSGSVQVIGWKTVPTTAGGTGLTSYTAGDLLYYASGTTLTKLAIGASGRWLGSSGTAPQWNAPAALTKTDDTNVTLTLGGSASTALLNAASLTLGWTGTLATTRGGTGLSSFTANAIVYASSTSALATSSNLTYDGSTVNITNANLKITDGNRLIMGASDPQIYGDSGVIKFRTSSTDRIGINTAAMYPLSSGGMDLGTSSLPWANLYFSNNLVQNTAAKGINFTANTGAAGKTSQLLNWYEEGTWTPTDSSGASLSLTVTNAVYTRNGRLVTVQAVITYPTTASGLSMELSGLPFTAGAPASCGVLTNTNQTNIALVNTSNTYVRLYTVPNAAFTRPTNADLSGKSIYLTITYSV